MAQLPKKANTAGNNDTNNFTVIPEGLYTLAVTRSELKETKSKNGYFLMLAMKVQEGEHTGKVLIERLNLVNPSAVAVEIANKQLNSLCVACGLADVEDSEELHGIPFQAKIAVEQATADWPASNKVARYIDEESANGSEAPDKPVWG